MSGRQLVTTWWIPDEYAGQTTATLHRVRELVARTGARVDICTFSGLHDNQRKIRQLQERGVLPEGVRLLNLFEDVRAWDAAGTLAGILAAIPDPEPATALEVETTSEESGEFARREYDETGELIHSRMFRADGSLLCHDYPVEVGGQKKRYQQFFHPDGTPMMLLGSTWDLYFRWLDELVGDTETVLVNESKSTARFMARYDNPLATKVHVFHESHLADSTNPFKSPLSVAHRRIIPHLDRFDGVVFLTDLQRRDVADRFGGGANLHTVPNAGPAEDGRRDGLLTRTRRDNRGIVVATLKPLKRIEHAIEAVASIHDGTGATLDIFGRDAGSEASLREVIGQTLSDDYVRLRGYVPGAAKQFEEASFSLMTSTTEGQSLVLLESMACGCVPISYDIRYGPSEIIVDGETGFLVEPGNVRALADAIERFLSLSAGRMRTLRNQCRERLAAFGDDEVQRRWGAVLAAAADQRRHRARIASVQIDEFAFAPVGSRLGFQAQAEVTLEGPAAAQTPLTATLFATGRDQGRPARTPLDVHVDGNRARVEGTVDPAALFTEKTVDLHLELTAGASSRAVRLRGESPCEVPGAEVFSTGYGNVSMRRR